MGLLPDLALRLGLRVGQGLRVVLRAPVRGRVSDGAIEGCGDNGSIVGRWVDGVGIIDECVRLIGVVDGAID
jgi:hypothetical protein